MRPPTIVSLHRALTCLPVCHPQGVTRRTEWCKQRHATILKVGEQANEQGAVLGPDGQPLDAAAGGNVANLVNLSKQKVGTAA